MPQKFLLVVNDLLQAIELLLVGLIALHRTVMYATHANSKNVVLGAFHLLEALYPILLHSITISLVVETPTLFAVPLSDIIAQKRFTMRRAHHDTTRVGHCLGTWCLKEGHRALMHGRPNRVGTQTE